MLEIDIKGAHMFDTVSSSSQLPPSELYFDCVTGQSPQSLLSENSSALS